MALFSHNDYAQQTPKVPALLDNLPVSAVESLFCMAGLCE